LANESILSSSCSFEESEHPFFRGLICKDWNGWEIKARPIGKRKIPIIGHKIPFNNDDVLEFELLLAANKDDANIAGFAVHELLPGKVKSTVIKTLSLNKYRNKKIIRIIVRSKNNITTSGEYECKLAQLRFYETGVPLLTGSAVHRDLIYMARSNIWLQLFFGGVIAVLIAILVWHLGTK